MIGGATQVNHTEKNGGMKLIKCLMTWLQEIFGDNQERGHPKMKRNYPVYMDL
jgi:hypothetical protein